MKLALLFKFQIIVCTSLLTYMDATLIFIFFSRESILASTGPIFLVLLFLSVIE